HVAVAGASHADIDLVEEEEIGARERVVVGEHSQERLEALSPLDVPGEGADEAREMPRGGGALGRLAVPLEARENAVELRAQRTVAPISLEVAAPCDRREVL